MPCRVITKPLRRRSCEDPVGPGRNATAAAAYDLIPNLVETAKGYGQQEQKVFLGIAEGRKAYAGANTVAEKAKRPARSKARWPG